MIQMPTAFLAHLFLMKNGLGRNRDEASRYPTIECSKAVQGLPMYIC